MIKALERLRARRNENGFTVVELVVVVVFIGILTALAIPSYNTIMAHAKVQSVISDMNLTVKYVELYKAEHGSYPTTSGWSYQGDTPNHPQRNAYIPGVVPTIARELPITNDKNGAFLYTSNGTDYKLIRYNGNGIPKAEMSQVPDTMKDYWSTAYGDRYGYWSAGGAGL